MALSDLIDRLQEGGDARREDAKEALSMYLDYMGDVQEELTERKEDRQAERTARTEAKAQGGAYTPESTSARWGGIADITGSVSDAVIAGISGGVSEVGGSISDALAGLDISGGGQTSSPASGSSSGDDSGGSILLPLLGLGLALLAKGR